MIVPEPPESCKVYTPKRLAIAMVGAVAQDHGQRWLEPSCGTGVFLQALNELGVPRRKVVAIDLDSQKSKADEFGQVLRGADFLVWSKPRGSRFDCVVGNPPYVSIQRLPETLRQPASRILDFNGETVGDRSNTWYPFMVQAIKLLRAGGNMAFVLPAACEYADYASCGRAALTAMFNRVDLIRSRRPLFDGVAEGVVVLIAQGKGGLGKAFRRHEAENLDEVVEKVDKVNRVEGRPCRNGVPKFARHKRVPFGQIVDIRIGGVTGDARYFLLTESQRKIHDLPKSSLVPVVSRGKHVNCGILNSEDWIELLKSDEKVWLFSPKPSSLSNSAVLRYLDLDANQGGCDQRRYKVRHRDPWYTTPLPLMPDMFLTGMSSKGLWMCINESPKLTATNTLYVGTFRELLSRAERFAWALAMLTSSVQKQVARARRVYADGLSKLEPGQVAELEIPVPPPIGNAVSVYRKAANWFLKGKQREAAKIADELVLG